MDMEKEFKELSTDVKNMNREFVGMNQKLTQLYESIVGNEKFGHFGLVERVNQLENKVENQAQTFNTLKNKAIGFSVGFASIFTVVFEIIKEKFFK